MTAASGKLWVHVVEQFIQQKRVFVVTGENDGLPAVGPDLSGHFPSGYVGYSGWCLCYRSPHPAPCHQIPAYWDRYPVLPVRGFVRRLTSPVWCLRAEFRGVRNNLIGNQIVIGDGIFRAVVGGRDPSQPNRPKVVLLTMSIGVAVRPIWSASKYLNRSP